MVKIIEGREGLKKKLGRESEVMKKNLLTLLIDNKSYSLSEDGSSRHRDVRHRGRITESAFYGVFAEHLRLIGSANRVEKFRETRDFVHLPKFCVKAAIIRVNRFQLQAPPTR